MKSFEERIFEEEEEKKKRVPRSSFKKQKFNHKQAVKCSSISFESLASTAIVCHQIRDGKMGKMQKA